MSQKLIATMKGYKATDENLMCRNHQFEVGKWYEVEGELELCGNGFHFCEQPSGVWAYYAAKGTRVWNVEAEGVLDTPVEPGADFKRVARRIRLVSEVAIGGHSNTGDSNTGHSNTGHSNTGHSNTGNGNTGNSNTGDHNTGDSNTGDHNTGDSNTGDHNTGYGNTGNRNTGYGNTGNRNTGDSNTGDHNTGCGNATKHSAGFFCQEIQTVRCFDVETGLTRDEFTAKYHCYADLSYELTQGGAIDFEPYKELPGITPEKLASLHAKFKAARGLK